MVTSSTFQLSSGTINNLNQQTAIVYNGVPNPIPPMQIVQASINSLMGGIGTQTLPLDLDPSRFPTITVGMAKWVSTTLLSGTNQTTTTPISQGNWILPIPIKGMDDISSVGWNEKNLFDEFTSMIKSVATAGAVAAGAAVIRGVFGVAEGAAAKDVVPSLVNLVADAGQAKTGQGINAFKTILLAGPEFKKWTMTWLFSPRNFQETQTLEAMLKAFRAGMTPTLGLGNFAWNYPNIFNLSLTSPEDQSIIRFKPAVCTQMGISRNPGETGAWFRPKAPGSAHYPSITQLTMNFMEMELWTGDALNTAPGINVNQGASPPPVTAQTNGIGSDGQTTIVPAI